MMTKTRFTALLLCLFCWSTFAQIDQYGYKRELHGIKDQWHKITLPDDLFGKVNADLSDIRIYGITEKHDTVEAPYLIKVASDEVLQKKIEFRLINQSKKEKGYYFTFEVPADKSINEIQLDFGQTNFDWKINLEGSSNQQEWFSLVEEYRILSIKNESTDFRYTKVVFPDAKYRYFRVFIASDTKPELKSAHLLYNEPSDGKIRMYPISSMTIQNLKQTRQTIVSVNLQYVPVSQLNIVAGDTIDYYRPVTLEYLTDSIKTNEGYRLWYNTITSGTLSSVAPNEMRFPGVSVKSLKITIENHDNAPLAIEKIEVRGFVHELVARFNTPATYYLVYGNHNASKPLYDIERFTDKIPQGLEELQPGAEQSLTKVAEEQAKPIFQNKNWLWAIMVVIIVVLGWVTVNMMKKR